MDISGGGAAGSSNGGGAVNGVSPPSQLGALLASQQRYTANGTLDEPLMTTLSEPISQQPRDRSNTWHGPMPRRPGRSLNQSTINEVPEGSYPYGSPTYAGSQTNLESVPTSPLYSLTGVGTGSSTGLAQAGTGAGAAGVAGVAGVAGASGGGVEVRVEGPGGAEPVPGKKPSSRKNAWGPHSYADLITNAIQSSPDKRLTLSQIYDWMVQNVPYFRDKGDNNSSAGWKNSIRHNLSLHSRFMRVQNEGAGKSSWWVINPEARGNKVRNHTKSMDSQSMSAMKKKRDSALRNVNTKKMGNKKKLPPSAPSAAAAVPTSSAGVVPGPVVGPGGSGGSPVSPLPSGLVDPTYCYPGTLSPEPFRKRSTSIPDRFGQQRPPPQQSSPSAQDQGHSSSPYGSEADGSTHCLPSDFNNRFGQISVVDNNRSYLKMLGPDPTEDVSEGFDSFTGLGFDQSDSYGLDQTGGQQQMGGGQFDQGQAGGQLTQRSSSQGDASMYAGPSAGGSQSLLGDCSDPLGPYPGSTVPISMASEPFSSYTPVTVPSQHQQIPMEASDALREVVRHHQHQQGLITSQQQQHQQQRQQQLQQQQMYLNMGAADPQLTPYSPPAANGPLLSRELSLSDLNEIKLDSRESLMCDVDEVLRTIDSSMDFQTLDNSIHM